VEEDIPSFLVLEHGLILHATGDERERDSISVSDSFVELIGVDSVGFGWHCVDCSTESGDSRLCSSRGMRILLGCEYEGEE
jgi:hypothetical protein